MKSPAAALWRTKRDSSPPETSQSPEPRVVPKVPHGISRNRHGQRVDIPTELHVSPAVADQIRDRKPRLCNKHHLLGECNKAECTYDHVSELSNRELEALMYLSRCQPCPHGSACTSARCTRGHMCPNGRPCTWGKACNFAKLHGIDTEVVEDIVSS